MGKQELHQERPSKRPHIRPVGEAFRDRVGDQLTDCNSQIDARRRHAAQKHGCKSGIGNGPKREIETHPDAEDQLAYHEGRTGPNSVRDPAADKAAEELAHRVRHVEGKRNTETPIMAPLTCVSNPSGSQISRPTMSDGE
ncbi:hypothetical protein N7522_001988 [Penicillium canescens]|uniref:Uncharacterized protein n=1 Tax=Penicillium canescens TaxID=5083 RepID=A0AAD6I575_PENCN|nr:uncharacterized protein N7446_014044 [Penicillium canescens]KAJ6018524.1 hypothetical protein N7522_001988 [Penicillium canescens]KAJ6034130.1 hypothetical protein N7460_009947 [Penicillium canescens]KAJ6039296.1 hypothetical protein N7446_014044 [Penicillium canescens]KAJ6174689.1 hypothetical protein N7485_005133 [Penicillium canescens]